jgi:putative CocE/NonD family hydrolase
MTENSPYETVLSSGVMVPMRDGVRLATDIYRPARQGQPLDQAFPVILERTPYGRKLPSRSELDKGQLTPHPRGTVAAFFVARGFVVVYQDCRGRHDSEGEFEKYLNEAEDGEDTVKWLLAQPWCDGQVATKGLSYAAHTQLALATRAPKGLKTFILDSGGFSSAFHCGIRQGGAFEMKQATWACTHAREALKDDPQRAQALDAEDLHAWFRDMPWRPGHSPLRAAPEYEQYLFDQWKSELFGPYWQQPAIYAKGYYDEIPAIPQVHVSSWYDVYVSSTLENYTALSKRHKDVRLIMGPWLHGDRNTTHAGDAEFGPAATFDGNLAPSWMEFRAQWFERWLKGKSNAVDDAPRVRYFLMGGGDGHRSEAGRLFHGGRWIASECWPPAGARRKEFHLRPTQVLSQDGPGEASGSITYHFDPRHPVPTVGGSLTSGRPIFEGGAFDQREEERFFGCTRPGTPLSARDDVLVFETSPLTEDMAVIGPVSARLFVSSDGPDTDFTLKLIDVYPPSPDYPEGFAMNITDGIQRCKYRDGGEIPKPMTPGEIYEIEVHAFATANLFKAGHRLRVDVSSSNFPKYDVNTNTGETIVGAKHLRTAANTLHLGVRHPSRLLLSVVPLKSLDGAGRANR